MDRWNNKWFPTSGSSSSGPTHVDLEELAQALVRARSKDIEEKAPDCDHTSKVALMREIAYELDIIDEINEILKKLKL